MCKILLVIIFQGNSSLEDQVNFWWNVLMAVKELGDLQRFYSENTEIPMFGQLKSLVLRSNVVIVNKF